MGSTSAVRLGWSTLWLCGRPGTRPRTAQSGSPQLVPLGDDLARLWAERPDLVMRKVEQALADGGVDVVDLRVLSADQMLDAVHANAAGQLVLSNELADAINVLILS